MLEQETQMLGSVADRLPQISEQLPQIAGMEEVEPVAAESTDWCYGSEADTATSTLLDTKSWVDFVLSGRVPEGETDIDVVNKALVALAGSPYLKDTVVMSRYRDLQFIGSGNDAVFDKEHEGSVPESKITSIDLRFRVGTACREYEDPDVFFPGEGSTRGKTRGNTVLLAKSVCHICIKRPECVDSALSGSDRGGVAGGLSVNQRREVRKIKSKRGSEVAHEEIERMWTEDADKIYEAILAHRI